MRSNPIPLIATLLLLSISAASQQDSTFRLLLKNGVVATQKNITDEFTTRFNARTDKTDGQSFAIIQFDRIPGVTERQQLQQAGIELLDYIPNNAYTVSIKGVLNKNILLQARARSVIELLPQQKLLAPLNYGIAPSWATKGVGKADVWISFYKTVSLETVMKELQKRNFEIISSLYKNYHILALRISLPKLKELASLPFIELVQPAPPVDQPLNFNSRNGSRANVLSASASVGGYDLHGEGVVIGVGDNADPLQHIDFTGRLMNRAALAGGAHGVHVTGTAGGAGLIEERYAGYLSRATIVSQAFGGIWFNAPAYVNDYGMVVTNNSYGAIIGCDYNGLYDLYSRVLDQQAFDLPNLQNVFAAGNSGASTCPPYPSGFGTVLGSYQSAKNVICVGNTTADGSIITASSKGPVRDGRTKPDISAMGTNVISTWTNNAYVSNTGTSMSSPAVAGGLGLLYQRYRQLNGNANPDNGLMKAIMINGATDKGNAGPDFSYGFGWMNLLRSVDMLNNNHYLTSAVANGNTNNHSITVPANTAQLKVMIVWNDPPANVLAAHTLVNDLDLNVLTPSNGTVLPGILDTLPANVDNPGTTGVDHMNNIEQVVISNPAAGTYTANVTGFAITQNPSQTYYLVYDIIPESTALTFPIGNEPLIPGESITVNWESYGNPDTTFKIRYSPDNGSTWTDSISNIAANLRQQAWTVSSTVTDQGIFEITRSGTSFISTSQPVTVVGRPTVSLAAVGSQCEGYIAINWTAVTGATDYEVMMLKGSAMQSVDIVPSGTTSYTFSGLLKDSTYWVTVRARVNGKPGLRAIAVSRQPGNGGCGGGISANDMKIDALITPSSGRQLTSTGLSATTTISARIKNLDGATTISNFDMKYSVNGGAWVTESVSTPVAPGATYTHNFATTYDFSAAGVYTLQVVVKKSTAPFDTVTANDTLTVIIKQLANPAITISVGSDFLDNFDAAPIQEYKNRQVGLTGLDRYDFVNSTIFGRIRTFVNSGIAYSGNRAITLDADRYTVGGNVDSLTGTFNLNAYNAATDDIRLDFRFKNHGQLANAANQVWVRGDDQKPWIAAYDLFANQDDPGGFKKSSSIEVSDLLTANSQAFSTSFQIRWGQWGQILTADNDGGAGYTFDDIHIYIVTDDIQMISIDTPIVSSCALSATTPVRVTVRNSANTTITNIPVKYRVDGGPIVTENIASIAGNATVQYTFTQTANLSALGAHTVEVWVDYATDSYRANDTATVDLTNTPLINSFPYLENFESGAGNWYANGVHSSWEFGTPASSKINTAASGSAAWKTSLVGNYNDQELSYLYSPCFNISGMTNPTLSFSLALDLEDCGASLCDGAWVEYSADGITWTKLGAFGSGTNWYNKNYAGTQLWSVQDYTRWHVATSALPTGLSNLRLRFVIASDPAANREGVAIDDIHIYDNTMGIYDGATMGAPVTQNISGGTSWIDFTSAGKLVASIQPNNLNMGNTDVRAYINTSGVRHTALQYYHDRNITIIPANASLADSVTVRFYFLDSETEALINATGCPACSKPSSAYELGVSKYTDVANRSAENGSVTDDVTSSNWTFITAPNAVKVPFDKGYYAEFKVKDFSEFWLDDGFMTGSSPLPVKLLSFNASKQPDNNVLVDWKTTDELNIQRYEIEVAKSIQGYQAGNYIKIGEVASLGNTSSQRNYSFNDIEPNKSGVRYYRLKVIETNGTFFYSAVKPVLFDKEIKWQVYPNPSSGVFNFVFQENSGQVVRLKVYDMSGKLIKQSQHIADGFVQKVIIDLRPEKFARGMYMIVADGSDQKVFKAFKQ